MTRIGRRGTRTDIRDGALFVAQNKTGAKRAIEIIGELADAHSSPPARAATGRVRLKRHPTRPDPLTPKRSPCLKPRASVFQTARGRTRCQQIGLEMRGAGDKFEAVCRRWR